MRLLRSVSLYLLLFLIVSNAQAQTTKTEPVSGEGNFNLFYQIAETFVKKGEYYNSIPYLKKAYSKEKDKTTKAAILFKIAESYRQINDQKNAEEWYSKAIKAGYGSHLAILHLAEAQKANGKYSEALENFKRYKQLDGETHQACRRECGIDQQPLVRL
jgi:tetratricopeptide (TPR) repeat protein